MIRSTGLVGLVTIVVLFAAVIASASGEPPFLASPEEALAFYLNSTAGWVQAAMAVLGLAAIGWIWFVVGLCLLLARAEGSPPWRSAVALLSGVILAALLLLNQRERRLVRCRRPRSGSRQLRLRCQLSRVGQPLARPGLFCGVLRLGGAVHARRRSLACGWWGIASGLGLVLARFFWTSMIWLLPYAAFWIWMIIMCIQLVRKPGAMLRAADGRASPGGDRP
jgi:hypothetical protein